MLLARILATGPWKPEFWLEKAGPGAAWMIAAIIFAESGLFFGFFLPGDSLLFMAGFLTSGGAVDFVHTAAGAPLAPVVEGMPPILLLLPVLFVAAVAGDQVGYWFGKKVGPALFTREDSRLFKQSHVTKAHAFLGKHGSKTIFLARFVPIVRTFAPIVAGVGEMRYRTFLRWNLFGGFVWAVGITSLGHYLGNIEFVRDKIEYAVIVIVALSLLPVVIEVAKGRKHARDEATGGPPAPAGA
jgi:membrane-associated protein